MLMQLMQNSVSNQCYGGNFCLARKKSLNRAQRIESLLGVLSVSAG